MSVNLLRRKRGPALIRHKGQSFYTKDASAFEVEINPFEVEANAFGPVAHRYAGRLVKVTFTPVGAISAAVLQVLYPFQNYVFGQYNTPVYLVTAVTAAADTVTIAGHGIVAGTGVRIGAIGTGSAVPAGLADNVTYFVSAPDANTIKFHATEAAALAGTGAIDITDAGAGTIKVIQNTPTVIHWFDGTRLTVHNSAISKMPSIEASTVKTLLGQVEVEGYPVHNTTWSGANSLVTLDSAAFTDSTFDPDAILTAPHVAKYGSVAPFDSLQPRDGVTVDFELTLGDVLDDAEGLLCRSISRVTASAKLRPLNLTEADLLTKINVQGGSAGRGKDLPFENLDLIGPGDNPFVRIFGATLTNSPLGADSNDDRIGELQFKSKRTFSAGAPNPVFYIGTQAPA